MADLKQCCAVCTHCRKGIPFGNKYFVCYACEELALCTPCHKKHPKSHSPFIKMALDKATSPDAPVETHRKCMYCGKGKHSRIDCNACEGTSCFDCYGDKLEIWASHEHKAYTFVRPPGDFCIASTDDTCLACTLGASLLHCGYCQDGIMEGDKIHECKTCTAKWDGTTSVCDACLPIMKSYHDGHLWNSYTYTGVHDVDENLYEFQCMECEQVMDQGSDWAQEHPHATYRIRMGVIERQNRTHKAMRQYCPKREVKDIDRDPDTLDEGNKGSYEKNGLNYYCPKCSFSSCLDCEDSGRLNHPHPALFKMKVLTVVSPPDFYNDLLEGKKRFCDQCKDYFWPNANDYLQCDSCSDYDICQSCIEKGDFQAAHPNCPKPPFMNYYEHNDQGPTWAQDQMTKALAIKEEREAAALQETQAQEAMALTEARTREEAAALAATRAENVRLQAELERRKASIAAAAAARPQPPHKSNLAPPSRPQAQRKKSSSGLGTALLGLGKAVLGAEVAMQRAQNGGGGGGVVFANNNGGGMSDGGGGGMDMNSFWGPINDAANSPIQ